MRTFFQPLRAIWLWMPLCARLSCAIVLLACLQLSCYAQSKSEFTPNDVEAVYLYNFGKFVQWPSAVGSDSRPFTICVLGQDNFGQKLDDLVAGETIQGRRIVARRLTSANAADGCQIVFIGDSEEGRLSADLDILNRKPVLTVSSLPVFLEHGGMIQFILQEHRVRFAVNLAAAQKTGLSLSSEMLKVAVHVEFNPPAEVKR